jgi:hypothetical protein
MFKKKGNSMLWGFSEVMYCQHGVCIAILVGSDHILHSHDINNELGGTSFKAHYRDWANKPMVNNFSKWASESFGKGDAQENSSN